MDEFKIFFCLVSQVIQALFVFLGKFLVGFYLNLKLVLEGFYFLILGSDCRLKLIDQWSDHVTVELLELEL